jgi:hypothetical protein
LLSFFCCLLNTNAGQKSYPKTNLEQFGLPLWYGLLKAVQIIGNRPEICKLNVGDAFLSFKASTMVEIFDWKEGQAPTPITTEWMITEAHNRGFEFRLVEPIPCYYGFKNRYSKSYP